MRKVLSALAACAMALPARAEPPQTHALRDIYKAGFHSCAAAMERLVNSFHPDDDSYAYLGVWSLDKVDAQTATALTSEELETGHAVTSVSAVLTAAKSCDVTVTQVMTAPAKPCKDVHEEMFKTWTFFGDFNKTTIYQDPDTPNGKAVLSAMAPAGCLVVRSVVAYGLRAATP